MNDAIRQYGLPGLSIPDASDAPPGYLAVLKTDACPKDGCSVVFKKMEAENGPVF